MSIPSIVRYTALRVAVLLAVGALLFLTGARGFVLLALAFVLSGLVSLVLLRGARGQVSQDLVERVERRGPRQGLMGRLSARIEAANQAEDDAIDRATGETGVADETATGSGDEPRPPHPR